jgi:Fic family protein
MENMYIYELTDWPHFVWDQEAIIKKLISLRHQQGRLLGGMQTIGFQFCNESVLQSLTEDVVKSSEIEGEILDQSLVRSSVARHLGLASAALEVADRNVEGVVEMVLDATQRFDRPLTQERLFEWHTLLFPQVRSGFRKIQVGKWRTGPVDVISGPPWKEIVHFEAPEASRVGYEMDLFLKWFNEEGTIDLALKAALAHLWFVTIHPFEDGNGRIGRALTDLLLARSENSAQRFYSLSEYIQKDRKNYYAVLEKTQKGNLNLTHWIDWFFKTLGNAVENALSTLNIVLYKSHFWESISEIPLNERQRKMINRLLDHFEGKLTTSKWAKITKCSQDTAYRDILDLLSKGILFKNPEGGRSTSYVLKKL